jgi:uncharacterized small protein (DUF1192 family)
MEKSNHQSGVDTLTLQLRESLKYELLKRENRELKEEVARLRAELKKTKNSKAFIKLIKDS